jgi:hypothetical protein
MFSIDSLLTLVKDNWLLWAHQAISCLSVYFGVDEFITIADNLAEIEATFESRRSGAVLQIYNWGKSNYDIAIKDLVYRPGVSPLELVTVETTKKIGQFLATSVVMYTKV